MAAKGGESAASAAETMSAIPIKSDIDRAKADKAGGGATATVAKPISEAEFVRILHLSDTHNLHDRIDAKHLPDAEIMIHTGDFTNYGTRKEWASFNRWMHGLRSKFKHIVVIPGNHDCRADVKRVAASMANGDGEGVAEAIAALTDPAFAKRQLSSATHVLLHEEVTLCGLRIFGSSWMSWHEGSDAGDGLPRNAARMAVWRHVSAAAKRAGAVMKPHRYDEIPTGIDILLTHGPARGVFDKCEGHSWSWGSSQVLRETIERQRPRVHLHGHLHEQRGVWCRPAVGQAYKGGVIYKFRGPVSPSPPPPAHYPPQLVSCNAMKNHPDLDGTGPCLAGQARLIVASRRRLGGAKADGGNPAPALPAAAATPTPSASSAASASTTSTPATTTSASTWWFSTSY